MDVVDLDVVRAGERFKKVRNKILGHADAGIRHKKGILSLALGKGRGFPDPKADRPAVRRVFDGVGEQVDEDLL